MMGVSMLKRECAKALTTTSRSLAGVILLSSQYFQPFEELTKAVSSGAISKARDEPVRVTYNDRYSNCPYGC